MRTVAICGSNERSRNLAPWQDDNIEKWTFNEACSQPWVAGKVHAVFQMHSPPVYRNPLNRVDPNHWEWLQQPHEFPIYMRELDLNVPACVRYPFEEICADLLGGWKWGSGGAIQFFTSSLAYAIALAIYQKYDRLLLYGLELESNTEYTYQRDCLTFWTGLALGRGIEVIQNCGSQIYDVPVYGGADVSLTANDFAEGLKVAEEEVKERAKARKLAEQQEYTLRTRGNGDLPEARAQLLQAITEHGIAEGVLSEVKRYSNKTAEMIASTGYALFSRHEFEGAAAHANNVQAECQAKLNYEGGRCDYVYHTFQKTGNGDVMREFDYYSKLQKELAFEMGRMMGVSSINRHYMQVVDLRLRSAGGEKSIAPLTGAEMV